jgi:uncharacterized integral membrane protein
VGFVPLFAASVVGSAGGASWPISVMIIVSTIIGLICIMIAKPAYADFPASTKRTARTPGSTIGSGAPTP